MVKVAVLGAAGGIGQPLSLLLKASPVIDELALFDVVPLVVGVAADLSHVNTKAVTTGYSKDNDGLDKALKNADVVVIPAGVPRKPGMTRDDLFRINAGIVRDLATAVAKNCPKASVLVISNPVNSTVPIVAEVLKKHNVYEPKRLFGVTTLDIVRASTFLAQAKPSVNPSTVKVPVIGGHSGPTIVPLLSQVSPALSSQPSEQEVADLTKRIQYGGDEVVKAKDGAGSATLSMAYAGARFTLALLDAMFNGKEGVVEYSYIDVSADAQVAQKVLQSLGAEGVKYFSLPVRLGRSGIESVQTVGNLSPYEKTLLQACVTELQGNIAKGVDFVAQL